MLPLLIVLALVIVLITKEIAGSLDAVWARRLNLALTVPLVPLGIAFLLILFSQIFNLFR